MFDLSVCVSVTNMTHVWSHVGPDMVRPGDNRPPWAQIWKKNPASPALEPEPQTQEGLQMTLLRCMGLFVVVLSLSVIVLCLLFLFVIILCHFEVVWSMS